MSPRAILGGCAVVLGAAAALNVQVDDATLAIVQKLATAIGVLVGGALVAKFGAPKPPAPPAAPGGSA